MTRSTIRTPLLLRAAFVVACVASPVLTLVHDGRLGAACGIVGYGGLIALSARENPDDLREPVSATAFWLAVGVMAFLGAYVVSIRV